MSYIHVSISLVSDAVRELLASPAPIESPGHDPCGYSRREVASRFWEDDDLFAKASKIC